MWICSKPFNIVTCSHPTERIHQFPVTEIFYSFSHYIELASRKDFLNGTATDQTGWISCIQLHTQQVNTVAFQWKVKLQVSLTTFYTMATGTLLCV